MMPRNLVGFYLCGVAVLSLWLALIFWSGAAYKTSTPQVAKSITMIPVRSVP